LTQAKLEFAKLVRAEYPQYNAMLNEPLSFQKQMIESNLEAVRKKRIEEEQKLQND
jgi:hypothetical protein